MDKFPSNYSYHLLPDENHECFRIKEVNDKESVKAWVDKYSKESKATWRIRKTFPNSGKFNTYKVDYRCCHNTDRRVQGTGPTKHTGCQAKLEVTINRYIKDSQRKNVDMQLINNYPCLVKLNDQHNHMIDTAEALKHRDLSPEVKEKILNLFYKGHNPATALKSYKSDLMLQLGNEYYKAAADGMLMPSYSIVHKLFEKEFSKTYGEISGEEMRKSLMDLLERYRDNGHGIAEFHHTKDRKHYFVILCTQIMLRIHERIIQASELMMVDAAGGVDKQRHRVYFLVTPCVVGGLPLGIIISDSEESHVFYQALECFKKLLPTTSFFSKNEPKVIITDNDLKEIAAIDKVFPGATKLLCQFHILKAMWAWLCDAKNNISKSHRQEIYFLFRKIQYAKTEEIAKNFLNTLLVLALKHKYVKLILHISGLFQIKEKWMTIYRQNLLLRGSNTTNFVEVAFKVLKDSVLERVMAFNLTQLVDYLLTRFDNYIYQRLIDVCNSRFNSSIYRHNVMIKKFQEKTDLTQIEVSKGSEDGLFVVKSEKYTYNVDVERGVCGCKIGLTGKLCKHSFAVLEFLEREVNTAFNILTPKMRADIFYIAEGRDPDANWFAPLHRNTFSITCGNQSQKPQEVSDLPCSSNIIYSPSSTINITNIPSSSGNIGGESKEDEVFRQWEAMFLSMKEKINENRSVFLPAAQKMVLNAAKYASTDTGLLTAMYTFATYSGIKQTVRKNVLRRCHKNVIGVQPTAIGRRKGYLQGKKRISAGRPRGQKTTSQNLALVSHDYTSFGSLPTRKRKAPHDLQTCVFDNKSLGNTKHAKQ